MKSNSEPLVLPVCEDELASNGGIDISFRIRPTPVFYVSRHGRLKKCLSRSTAINRLAHFMTEAVFKRAGINSRVGERYTQVDGCIHYERGEASPEYIASHHRCIRRIRRLLAKQREIEKWKIKHDKLMAEYQALIKAKPF